VDFLQTKKERPLPGDEDDDFTDLPDSELNLIQTNGVFYMAGWAVFKTVGECATCNAAVKSALPCPCEPALPVDGIRQQRSSRPSDAGSVRCRLVGRAVFQRQPASAHQCFRSESGPTPADCTGCTSADGVPLPAVSQHHARPHSEVPVSSLAYPGCGLDRRVEVGHCLQFKKWVHVHRVCQ